GLPDGIPDRMERRSEVVELALVGDRLPELEELCVLERGPSQANSLALDHQVPYKKSEGRDYPGRPDLKARAGTIPAALIKSEGGTIPAALIRSEGRDYP